MTVQYPSVFFFPNCMGNCFLHRIIMAENQEMSPIEMKVARQIEVTLI